MSNKNRAVDIFKILFQTEFQPETDTDELVELYVGQNYHLNTPVAEGDEDDDSAVRADNKPEIEAKDVAFVKNKLSRIVEHLAEIDDRIESESKGWKLERIGKAELAILRLSVYEILFDDEAVDAVTADVAVRLAKEYAEEKSSAFVNGILGTIIRNK